VTAAGSGERVSPIASRRRNAATGRTTFPLHGKIICARGASTGAASGLQSGEVEVRPDNMETATMRNLNQDNITQAVLARFADTPDPRLREI